MYRKIESELLEWKDNFKKPLMLIGARQTGKTYILEEFCKNNFENYLYIDVKKDIEIQKIFESSIDPEIIISSIELLYDIKFNPENTVIFFDEIQESERAIESLKYFAESDKPYKIVTAGSLLGVKINRFKSSFPVGKVTLKYLYSMDFEEFLLALGKNNLISEIRKHYLDNSSFAEPLHNMCLDLYKKYLIVGGMPEVVNNFISVNCNIQLLNYSLQDDIVTSYIADMNKYTLNTESIKINATYKSIPKELARVNNSFKFSLIDKNARFSRYKTSIEWLISGSFVFKCSLAARNESPFSAFSVDDSFKLYLNDTGLLRALSNIDYREILLDKNEMFKSVISENYVAKEFFAKHKELFYYVFDRYEIDFIIKQEGDVIPVEVKSGRRTTSKSLNQYINKYQPKYAIRISEKNFGFENNIKSVPFYAVFCIS